MSNQRFSGEWAAEVLMFLAALGLIGGAFLAIYVGSAHQVETLNPVDFSIQKVTTPGNPVAAVAIGSAALLESALLVVFASIAESLFAIRRDVSRITARIVPAPLPSPQPTRVPREAIKKADSEFTTGRSPARGRREDSDGSRVRQVLEEPARWVRRVSGSTEGPRDDPRRTARLSESASRRVRMLDAPRHRVRGRRLATRIFD